MRVVLFAEGGRDLGSAVSVAPGDAIPETHLGAAHVLVARCVTEVGETATFEGPPRSTRGRRLKGSQLLQRGALLKALTWPSAKRRPALAVLLVDADGDVQRYARLTEIIADRPQRVPAVVGVAVQELEAWLLADQSAVHAVLGQVHDPLPEVESMKPGEAKPILESWMGSAEGDKARRWSIRREIASRCELSVVAKRCSAFARFRRDLRAELP